jgi:coproporphyrinogen III oxidase-like Fe-S oxidoreductase
VENDKGVMVFGGGSPSSLSEEQFNQLKSIVMDLRTSIIEGN